MLLVFPPLRITNYCILNNYMYLRSEYSTYTIECVCARYACHCNVIYLHNATETNNNSNDINKKDIFYFITWKLVSLQMCMHDDRHIGFQKCTALLFWLLFLECGRWNECQPNRNSIYKTPPFCWDCLWPVLLWFSIAADHGAHSIYCLFKQVQFIGKELSMNWKQQIHITIW